MNSDLFILLFSLFLVYNLDKMNSATDLIKEKLDIVEFLRGYLNIQPAGKNFKALCPFHREKTPSFMISPERQSWHCFGCNLGGDIFAFLMRYENLDFGEALRVLAERAGVELRYVNPAEYKHIDLLYEINNAALNFFKKSLADFSPAKQYLYERGLEEQTIKEFELGWAPAEKEALNLYLLKIGYRPQDVLRAGLAIKSEKGFQIDRFRGRIMFPIHNHFGKVVGFTGRILPRDESWQDQKTLAKYINSPETPIFSKSKILYGFFMSKSFIKQKNEVFLVEGQMDLLMSWQSGIKNVVATSGTALTQDHLKILKRLTDRIILSFDSDEAGKEAAERAIDLAEMDDFEVRVAVFEKFKDPAEAAQSDPNYLVEIIDKAKPATEFYFEKYLPSGSFEINKRENLKNLRIVLGKIKNLVSAVERNFWLKKLSERVHIDEKVLVEEAERIKTALTVKKEDDVPLRLQPKTRRELIGEELLSAAVASGKFEIIQENVPYLAVHHQEIFKILSSGGRKSEIPELDETLNFILLKAKALPDEEIKKLKKELTREYIKEKRRELALIIKEAEAKGSEEDLNRALRDLDALKLLEG